MKSRLAALLLVGGMTVMAGATIAPALPRIQEAFAQAPHADLWTRMVLTLPGLFTALIAPIAGAALDRFGRKRILVGATVIYGIAGTSGYFAQTLSQLVAGRAVLGFAVGVIMTAATTLAADYFQGDERRRVMGIQYAVTGFSGVMFLSVAGFLAEIGWRMPFLIYLSAFAILPAVILYLPEPERAKPVASESPAVSESPAPLGLVALIYGLALLGMGAFYLIPVQLPFYLSELGVIGARKVGYGISFFFLFSALFGFLFQKAKAWLSFPAIFLWINGMTALGYVIISRAQNFPQILAGLAVTGMGTGMLIPALNVWMSQTAPESRRGRLLGGVTTCLFMGQFLSPLVSQAVVRGVGVSATFALTAGVLALVAFFFSLSLVLGRGAASEVVNGESVAPAET